MIAIGAKRPRRVARRCWVITMVNLAFALLLHSASSADSHSEVPPRRTSGAQSLHAVMTMASMWPSDGVLENLIGPGMAIRVLGKRNDAELGISVLRGRLRSGSEGIRSPFELAISSRARFRFVRHRWFGLNGFVGARYGHLFWQYDASVFGIDQYGYGEEVGGDSLSNFSAFVGLGITPIRMKSAELGVNVRRGMRLYYNETSEGFGNDLFLTGTFSQVDIEFVMRF